MGGPKETESSHSTFLVRGPGSGDPQSRAHSRIWRNSGGIEVLLMLPAHIRAPVPLRCEASASQTASHRIPERHHPPRITTPSGG